MIIKDADPGFYKPRPPKRTVAEVKALIPTLVELKSNPADLRAYPQAADIFADFLTHLESGALRAAEQKKDGSWRTNQDVREMIDVGFSLGDITVLSHPGNVSQMIDKNTYPPQQFPDYATRLSRFVATGMARRGSHIGERVVFMNGAYANVGAYVDDRTMVDTNALVGSAAQVGKRCHLSAGVVIAGVLEPASAHPCIVEDDVFMGAGSMIAEGVVLKKGSALSMGTMLYSSTRLFDLVNEKIIAPQEGRLIIPENALVMRGMAPFESEWAKEHGLVGPAAVIVRYYDPATPMPERRRINESLR